MAGDLHGRGSSHRPAVADGNCPQLRRSETSLGGRHLCICIICLLAALATGSCAPQSARPIPATPTVTSPPPTPTLAFPTLIPTPTWTPPALPSPSTAADLELGSLVYSEDFSQTAGWELGEDLSGATSISEGQLKLAVRAQGVFRLAQAPAHAEADFFLRALVRPELCSPGDVFGLAFRVNSRGEHYRFGLTCEGGARAYRFTLGSSNSLAFDEASDAVIPGPGGSNELAVAVQGGRMRFFVNELEIFSLQDSQLAQGGFGFFARALGGGQLTVSFDDFEIWSLAVSAAPTSTPE